jgi:hypothetical protein
MYYAGIDYHKRYSVVCAHDAQGRVVHEQRGGSPGSGIILGGSPG